MTDRDYPKNGPEGRPDPLDRTALDRTSLDRSPPDRSDLDRSLDVDELHMRETLGLNGRARPRPQSAAAKPRHRFVQDGEVQVIHLGGGQRDGDPAARSRVAVLEESLAAERAARGRAEHAAQAAAAQVQALGTKLAHLEMAHREHLTAERQAREAAEAELQRVLAEHAAARPPARRQVVAADPAKPKLPRSKEPQPVKWWISKPTAPGMRSRRDG